MTALDGWKYVQNWAQARIDQAVKDLKTKKFSDVTEVRVLQTRISAYEELFAEVSHRIRKGQDARKKERG